MMKGVNIKMVGREKFDADLQKVQAFITRIK